MPGKRRRDVALRRVVNDPVDPTTTDRLFEMPRENLIAKVLSDESTVLDDAAIHVDDVERAIGR